MAMKFGAFVNTLRVNVSATQELARRQMVEAVVAEKQRVLAETKARSDAPPAVKQIVDGRADAPVASVKPIGGMVILRWTYLREIAQAGIESLIKAAPRDTSEYIDSIRLFVGENDTPATLDDIGPHTQTCLIAPTTRYSRRLEIGFKADGKTPFVVQVQPLIVQRARLLLRREYGRVAQVDDEWLTLAGFAPFKAARLPGGQKPSRRDKNLAAQGAMRSPGMRIRLYR